MLSNLFGIGWMMELFELCLYVDQIDRKMCSNGVKWFIISIFMLSVHFVVMFAWQVVVESGNVK